MAMKRSYDYLIQSHKTYVPFLLNSSSSHRDDRDNDQDNTNQENGIIDRLDSVQSIINQERRCGTNNELEPPINQLCNWVNSTYSKWYN